MNNKDNFFCLEPHKWNYYDWIVDGNIQDYFIFYERQNKPTKNIELNGEHTTQFLYVVFNNI